MCGASTSPQSFAFPPSHPIQCWNSGQLAALLVFNIVWVWRMKLCSRLECCTKAPKVKIWPNNGCSYHLLSLIDWPVKSPSISADGDVTLSGFKEKFKTYVIVDSSGVNKWMSPATFKSSCDMLVTFYPFDKQRCEMTFGSWTFDNRLLKMVSKSNKHTHAGLCDLHLMNFLLTISMWSV